MNSAFSSSDKIVGSLLDTDFYKLTMMQGVLHQFPDAHVEWAFKSRNDEDLLPYKDEIQRQINMLSQIKLSSDEEEYLKTIPYFKPDFIRFLKLFRFDPSYVQVEEIDHKLSIRLAGPWLHVILFEIVILAIVSEVRNRALYPNVTLDDVLDKLSTKLQEIEGWDLTTIDYFKLADFGTRRRFSRKAQGEVISYMTSNFPGTFVGTSNVFYAMHYGLKPIGTMAHEWAMAHQQLGGHRLADFQKEMQESWVKEYRGELGIALTDCVTTDSFLKNHDLYFAKLFDGLRHDSGDPKVFADKCIEHYESLGIDPLSKTLVFSDGLNFEVCKDIIEYCMDRIIVSFGIGTNLTCDIEGVKPLNIVVKMISCNGQPVAKISDAPGKTMCEDEEYVSYLKHVFKV